MLNASIARRALGCLHGWLEDLLPQTRILRAEGARILVFAGGATVKQSYKQAVPDRLCQEPLVRVYRPRGSLKGPQPLHGNPQDRLCRFEGLEPAAASGGNKQAERRKSQGVLLAARLCEFPGRRNSASAIIWSVPERRARNDVLSFPTAARMRSRLAALLTTPTAFCSPRCPRPGASCRQAACASARPAPASAPRCP